MFLPFRIFCAFAYTAGAVLENGASAKIAIVATEGRAAADVESIRIGVESIRIGDTGTVDAGGWQQALRMNGHALDQCLSAFRTSFAFTK